MKKLRLALVGLTAGLAGSCAATAPVLAAAPAPPPKVVVLRIYPKLVPPLPNEKIIQRAVPISTADIA